MGAWEGREVFQTYLAIVAYQMHDRRFRSDRTNLYAATDSALASNGFPRCKHRPGDPRQLVGQGDDRDIGMGPAHQLFRPSAERRVTLRDMGQRGTCPVNQLFAQIPVAALADSEQLRLAPSSELPRNQAQPCGEIATVVEAFRSTDATRRGSRRQRRDQRCALSH